MGIAQRLSHDLVVRMMGLGLLVGAIFPFLVFELGIPRKTALTPAFFGACLGVGAVVGAFCYFLAKHAAAPKLKALVASALRIELDFKQGGPENENRACSVEDKLVPEDSNDIIGKTAHAFNHLATTLCDSLNAQRSAHMFIRIMSTNLELEDLANNALDLFIDQTGASGGIIIRDEGGTLGIVACRGIKNPAEVVSSDHVLRVFNRRKSEALRVPADIHLDGILAEFRPAETLCFPVLYEGVALGVIVLASSDNFGPKQRALAEFFSHGFGLPLNNAFAHERLEKLAALDPLTGVYNRGFGLGRLHEEFERAVRASSHLGVLMMDIDFFKAVNDTYGHLVGDRVLKAVASSARSALRQGDVLLRYGGEEFLAVLPAAPSDDLAQVGERIRRAVADIAVPEAHQIVRVTLSLGGVALQDQGVEREASLLELADAALYQAKQTGRDKVQIVR